MVLAGAVDATLHDLTALVQKDDIIIDGGNSYYIDDIRRAAELMTEAFYYGCRNQRWSLGPRSWLLRNDRWRNGNRSTPGSYIQNACRSWKHSRTPGRDKVGGTAEEEIFTAAHPVPVILKWFTMASNTRIMAAYAEGLNILRHADAGSKAAR
jgi:6-phosphogluconate dehydrogenase